MQKENVQDTGTELYGKLLEAFNQGAAEVLALYNEDAIIEYPYAPSFGMPVKLNKPEYENHVKGALQLVPDIKFSRVRVYQTTEADSYWAEAHGETVIPKTGKLYEQDYVMYFTVREGKFSFYREYWNSMVVGEALGGGEFIQGTFNASVK